jgi:hypothetical protein
VWGREGSKNVLLPISSEPYKEANQHTTLVNNKLSLRDIKIGDHVTLIDKGTQSGSRDGVYLGRMFVVCTEDIELSSSNTYTYSCAEQNLAAKTVDKYVFRDPASKEIYAINKPSVGAMVQSGLEKTTLNDNIAEINGILSVGGTIDNFPPTAVLVLSKAADLKKVSVILEDTAINLNGTKFAEVGQGYYSRAELAVVTKDDMNYYITSNARDNSVSHNSYDNNIAALFGIQPTSFKDGHIRVKYNQSTVSNGHSIWGNRSQIKTVPSDVLTDFDIADYKAQSIWLVAGDFKARVFTTSGNFSRFVRNF